MGKMNETNETNKMGGDKMPTRYEEWLAANFSDDENDGRWILEGSGIENPMAAALALPDLIADIMKLDLGDRDRDRDRTARNILVDEVIDKFVDLIVATMGGKAGAGAVLMDDYEAAKIGIFILVGLVKSMLNQYEEMSSEASGEASGETVSSAAARATELMNQALGVNPGGFVLVDSDATPEEIRDAIRKTAEELREREGLTGPSVAVGVGSDGQRITVPIPAKGVVLPTPEDIDMAEILDEIYAVGLAAGESENVDFLQRLKNVAGALRAGEQPELADRVPEFLVWLARRLRGAWDREDLGDRLLKAMHDAVLARGFTENDLRDGLTGL